MMHYYVMPGIKPLRKGRRAFKQVLDVQLVGGILWDHFGVTIDDLRVSDHHDSIAYVRHICVYILDKYCFHTNEETAHYFNRDRSTVIKSIRNVKDYRDVYPHIAKEVELIELKVIVL